MRRGVDGGLGRGDIGGGLSGSCGQPSLIRGLPYRRLDGRLRADTARLVLLVTRGTAVTRLTLRCGCMGRSASAASRHNSSSLLDTAASKCVVFDARDDWSAPSPSRVSGTTDVCKALRCSISITPRRSTGSAGSSRSESAHRRRPLGVAGRPPAAPLPLYVAPCRARDQNPPPVPRRRSPNAGARGGSVCRRLDGPMPKLDIHLNPDFPRSNCTSHHAYSAWRRSRAVCLI